MSGVTLPEYYPFLVTMASVYLTVGKLGPEKILFFYIQPVVGLSHAAAAAAETVTEAKKTMN